MEWRLNQRYHLHVQGQLHPVVQPGESHDGLPGQSAAQGRLPRAHQVVRHRPALNGPIAVSRQQPGAWSHTLITGGTDPLTGGTDTLTGGTDTLTGGTDPHTGGTDPLTGGTDPLTGGTDTLTGGTDTLTGGTDGGMTAH